MPLYVSTYQGRLQEFHRTGAKHSHWGRNASPPRKIGFLACTEANFQDKCHFSELKDPFKVQLFIRTGAMYLLVNINGFKCTRSVAIPAYQCTKTSTALWLKQGSKNIFSASCHCLGWLMWRGARQRTDRLSAAARVSTCSMAAARYLSRVCMHKNKKLNSKSGLSQLMYAVVMYM